MKHPHLSVRQQQTLDRLLAGDQEKQVARLLKLSKNTVHIHVKSIYRKYGVCSRPELLAVFIERWRRHASMACEAALESPGLRMVDRLNRTTSIIEDMQRELVRQPAEAGRTAKSRRARNRTDGRRARGFVPRPIETLIKA
jgi:DNA-binding CsgD family transcriptional regulator